MKAKVKKAKANHDGMLPVSGFIPEQVAKKARAYADERGIRMPGLLAEALDAYLKNPPKVEKVAKKVKEDKAAKAA